MILSRTPPLVRSLALLACLGLAACGAAGSAVAAGPKAAGPKAAAKRACEPPKYPGMGYFTELTVSGTSCRTGKKVAIGYYKCRVRNGGRKGACPRATKVLGYACRESRPASGMTPVEFNARVTCRRTGRTIVHSYQQNL